MPRLRRVSPGSPGWTRRRTGRGFHYVDEHGDPLDPDQVERVRALVIPPAWRDVWICPLPQGHLQATGLDAAGRRQYLYHPRWRELRDRAKFQRVTDAAHHLPQARDRVAGDLALDGMPLERAVAAAVRLLDLGCFRIGNDCYADANGSFGLATLQRRHVRRDGDSLAFRFVGKSGIEHRLSIADPAAIEALQVMRRRHGGDRLLAYRNGNVWHDLTSTAVNGYLADLFGGTFTAKDFRTWHATVLFATSLAESLPGQGSATARARTIRASVQQVATYLGNTAAVARGSYIDPRITDRYQAGETIADTVARHYRTPDQRRAALEQAVLDLLG
ncbi:DNA topoisomerase IB [Micropruina sp.]|uniref:DNA topoisomerase IB n=1 Tax=Micropruina sp. TaxID=2737536 RepID=UPI0039E56E50